MKSTNPFTAALLSFLVATTSLAAAGLPGREATSGDRDRTTLAGSVHPLARPEFEIGAAAPLATSSNTTWLPS